jgi:hypothetical protein
MRRRAVPGQGTDWGIVLDPLAAHSVQILLGYAPCVSLVFLETIGQTWPGMQRG